jgi:hypothetical protein
MNFTEFTITLYLSENIMSLYQMKECFVTFFKGIGGINHGIS